MTTTVDRGATVARIVADHPQCARVFQAHHIDFCCRGNVPVAQAAAERGVDLAALFAELDAALAEAAEGAEIARLSTPALIAHIVDRHHGYLRRALPRIGDLVRMVVTTHGARAPKLVDLAGAFHAVRQALEPHLDEEEAVLFPTLTDPLADRAHVLRLLAVMGAEHEDVGRGLERIRILTDDFHAPADACTAWKALWSELATLVDDVLRHVHLENHVLRPRFLGPVHRYMTEDHARLEGLLNASVADPERFDHEAFERFRGGLLRHIGIEEKVLLPDVRRRRGGEALPLARQLRVEHGALTSLMVPTPDAALVAEVRALLRDHNPLEEEPGGLYDVCDLLAGDEAEVLAARARAARDVPLAPHNDGPRAHRHAASALAAMNRISQ
jgi:regulator of cell morphogenesis and NO signaling